MQFSVSFELWTLNTVNTKYGNSFSKYGRNQNRNKADNKMKFTYSTIVYSFIYL